jgi:hypothetical protein
MLETAEGIRVEVSGDPRTGGTAIYDSSDGAVSGVIAFDTLTAEIGAPLRFTWRGAAGVLDHGDIVNTLVISAGR